MSDRPTMTICRFVVLEFAGVHSDECLWQSRADQHGTWGSCSPLHSRQHRRSLWSQLHWGE